MPRKQKSDEPSARKKSKTTRMRERELRCDSLYFQRRLSAPEICDVLTDESLFDEGSSDAANLRWTQERVKLIREGAEPDKIIRLQRPAETQRYTEGLAALLRETLDIIGSKELVSIEKVTPKGDVRTVEEPLVSEDTRVKAIARAESLVEKIALVNMVAVKGSAAAVDPANPDEKKEREPFVFNVSGKSLDSLIGERVGGGGDVN